MPAQGHLVAHAFTSEAMLPVPDTTVTVTQLQSNGLIDLISVQITDRSGKTPPITVSTPDISESQSPGTPHPFATINITAENPLYERIAVEETQVFPNTVTIQNFMLIPLDEAPEMFNKTELFDTPPQDL